MNYKLKDLREFSIAASDGELGKVKECFFDDTSWTVRYFVVETGSWLFGKKVLISPQAINHIDSDKKNLSVNLTKEQVESSPDIDTEKTVSRQHEIELHKYYPWQNYWGAGSLWAGGIGVTGMMMPVAGPMEVNLENTNNAGDTSSDDDPHLRSTHAVSGYTIHATDGEIGDVEDLIIDDTDWKIRYTVVDTGNWFPGKKVLISPFWIKEIKWETSEVFVNATVDQVKNSPEYDSNRQIDRDYESNLQNYYHPLISPKQ